jgi:hypothetical protein
LLLFLDQLASDAARYRHVIFGHCVAYLAILSPVLLHHPRQPPV